MVTEVIEPQESDTFVIVTNFLETFDGGVWIDTNTLEILDSEPDEVRILPERPPRWKQALRLRWQLWLDEHLPKQADLRMVSHDGYWLSPLKGHPVREVPVVDGHIDHRVIDAMANYLASIPQCDPRRLRGHPRRGFEC